MHKEAGIAAGNCNSPQNPNYRQKLDILPLKTKHKRLLQRRPRPER